MCFERPEKDYALQENPLPAALAPSDQRLAITLTQSVAWLSYSTLKEQLCDHCDVQDEEFCRVRNIPGYRGVWACCSRTAGRLPSESKSMLSTLHCTYTLQIQSQCSPLCIAGTHCRINVNAVHFTLHIHIGPKSACRQIAIDSAAGVDCSQTAMQSLLKIVKEGGSSWQITMYEAPYISDYGTTV
jgi:hypothetical protein